MSWRTPLLIAPVLAAWLLHLYLATPGFLSFDAAYQLWQARTSQYDNMHPVAMTLLWQFCNSYSSSWQGPMALLVVQCGMYFIAIAWLTLTFSRYGYWRALVVGGVIAFWPPFFLMQAHLWKDCLLASSWALACAALLSEVHQTRFARSKLGFAALLLILGALLRHNAILALPPLIYWISGRLYPMRRKLQIASTLVVVPALLLANSALARLVHAKPSPAWAVTAIFDLTAEAIGTGGQWHVPANLRVDVPIARFAEAFKPYSGVPLFSASIVVDGVSVNLSAEDKATLLRNWISLPLRSPLVYLRHRSEMARIFLLPRDSEIPPMLWFAPISTPFADNPPYALPRLATYQPQIAAFSTQFPCAIGLYVLLGLIAYVRVRRANDLEARLAKVILLASACGFFPLLVLMNATEFRYGFSAMFSALLILLWVFLRTPEQPAIAPESSAQ